MSLRRFLVTSAVHPLPLAALVLQAWAFASRASAPVSAQEMIRVQEPAPKARLVLLVRNPASTSVRPTFDPEPPIQLPAPLLFAVRGSGTLQVSWMGRVLAAATVETDGAGRITAVAPIHGVSAPSPGPDRRSLRVDVPPSAEGTQRVRIEWTVGSETAARELMIATEIADVGALPIGHTFVSDVSIVDGHLLKEIEDLDGPLSFARAYTNRPSEPGPMGPGWSHRFLSVAFADAAWGRNRDVRRYLLVTDGMGQAFTCAGTGCRSQRGYHSSLREERDARDPAIVFRAKSGKEYRYVNRSSTSGRYRLEVVTDPVGRRTELEYGGAAEGGELVRVIGPGRVHFLRFVYEPLRALSRVVLARVELHRNPLAPRPPESADPATPERCVTYTYDERGRLSGAARHDRSCDATPTATERYEYSTASEEALADNLVTHVDWAGVATAFEYVPSPGRVEGEKNYPWMGDPRERVERVVETGRRPVQFVYVLAPSLKEIAGHTAEVFETRVRFGNWWSLSAPDVYEWNAYGLVLRYSNVGRSRGPVTSVWNSAHVQEERKEDRAGAMSLYRFDELGNVTDQRLRKSASDPMSVEKWWYDRAFSVPICNVDPQGHLTLTLVDSDGSDPMVRAPVGTGLVLETIEYAERVDLNALPSSATCLDHADSIGPSPGDRITRRLYCEVNGVKCTSGSNRGDLAKESKGLRSEFDQSVEPRHEQPPPKPTVHRRSLKRPSSGG